MPAFPSALSGFIFHAIEWPLDSCNLERYIPLVEGKQIQARSFWTVASSRPLASPSDDRKTSCCEKRTPVPRFVSAAACGSAYDSDRDEANLLSYYGCRDRKRPSDESGSGTDYQMSKRERNYSTESWKFQIMASSSCKSASLVASDVIGTIDFDHTGNLFATGGIARKIRISSYLQMIGEGQLDYGPPDQSTDLWEDDDADESSRRKKQNPSSPVRDHELAVIREICTPGKLSSLKWAPGGSDVLGCGDYDGVVTEWSVEHRHAVSERYEHSGQRVWSLDYSKSTPSLSASSSADGTVRVWKRGTDKSVLVIRPDSGVSLCSAEFNPVADHLIAIASADANVYLYDLRKSPSPLLKLSDHTRAVSYVRFLGKDTLVSASIDSTLKLWDITAPVRTIEDDKSVSLRKSGLLPDIGGAYLKRTFSSHSNVKHFVGLSLHGGASILACGSETNAVFVYSSSRNDPILKHEFPDASSVPSDLAGSGNSYVGAVCWREQHDPYCLVAANSDGVVHVLQATRRIL